MGNASGKAAKGQGKKSVHWNSAVLPSTPGRPQLVPALPTDEPDVVTLRWDAPSTDGGAPIIGYLVEHKRTGSPHWVRATPGLVVKPELSMSGLEPGWRYQFRVTAHNVAGPSEPSELSEPLTVTFQRTVITTPKFTQELNDTTALENEQIEFVVKFTGIPTPTVCWYKDGFEIFSSRRTKIITDNGQSILIIHQTAIVDEGEIKCTATNKSGHTTTKAQLKVEAIPKIRLPRQYEDGIIFEMDEIIRLKISVAGKPVPQIYWSHNGEQIVNNDRCEITTSDKTCMVKINGAKRADRGEYHIRAVNQLGEDSASFLVTVTDRPLPPRNIKVMTLGKSVTLSWSAPDDDGGCKIGNYIIEYYRLSWNVWLKATTSRKLTATLGELIEGSEYKFRVKAENPYGVSDPSEESEIIFIPDPKRGLLQPPVRRSQPRETMTRSEDIPPVAKRRKKNMSENEYALSNSSSKSSLDSRPISPDLSASEPVRPVRGNKVKTPLITPELSPIAGRKERIPDITVKNIFDRSSMTRDITYGSPTIRITRSKDTDNIPQNETPIITHRENFRRSRTPSPTLLISTYQENNSIFYQNNETNEQNSKSNKERPEQPRHGDMLHGSSEFMLVILPNQNNKNHQEKRAGSTSNIIFDEVSVAPPMSLSAPELGMEPPYFGSLRSAVSSSELLHERAMTRFIEAAAAEDAELQRRRQAVNNNRHLLATEPKESVSSQESEDVMNIERKQALIRRLSGSGIAKQVILRKRLSISNSEDGQDDVEMKSESKSKSVTPEPQPIKIAPDILISKTNEDDVIEKVHAVEDQMKLENNDVKLTSERLKPAMIRQRSASEEMEEEVFEQVRAKMKTQESQETQKKNIEVAKEDEWEEEILDETPTDEIEESVSEEESSDEPPWSEDDVPPMVVVKEEETYHPRMMISRVEVPVVKEEEIKKDVPFEILTKPTSPPDPNFVPKPILKKRDTEKEQQKDISKPKPDKPIRKSILPPKFEAGFLKKKLVDSFGGKQNNDDKPEKQTTDAVMPKLSRWGRKLSSTDKSEPGATKPVWNSIKDKLAEARKNSIEENKVVIDYYGKIVEEHGQSKKTPTKLYLSTDALKAAAESETSTVDKSLNEEQLQIKEQEVITKTEPIQNHTPKNEIISTVKTISKQQLEEIPRVGREKVSRFQNNKTQVRSTSLNRNIRKPDTPEPNTTVRTQLRSTSLNRNIKKPGTPEPNTTVRTQLRSTSLNRNTNRNESKKLITPEPSTRSTSPETRPLTPEQEILLAEAETNVRNTLDYMTDVAMFLVACWLYLFKDERLAIPVLLLMIYRQLSEEIKKYLPSWLIKTKQE